MLGTFFKRVCTKEYFLDWQRLWDDCIQEETQEESKRNKQVSSNDNLSLVSKKRKGKEKSSSKKGNNDGGSSQPGKKDLSKIKCFSCHKNGNYASQCPKKKKKGKGNMHTIVLVETQLDEFATKFEKDYSLASLLYTNIAMMSAWFLDSGASHHMKK